jgi:ubiquinone/menaquinone biosynthesis C-methylase UbiE
MQTQTYTDYLKNQQYGSGANLNARIRIHQLYSTNKLGLPRWIFNQLQLPPEADVLEVGCGVGNQWLSILELIPPGWKLTLTDFSAGILAEAEQNLAGKLPNVRFQVADAQQLPFPDHSFDAVIANHMLYHLPDRPKAFQEFQRVLRPGGKLYAATNGKHHMTALYAWADRFGLDTASLAAAAFRVGSFSLENGAEQLEPYFDEVRLEAYHDALEVTEADPLVDYIVSVLPADLIEENLPKLEKFQRWAQTEITEHGAIHIPKSAGLFIATNR